MRTVRKVSKRKEASTHLTALAASVTSCAPQIHIHLSFLEAARMAADEPALKDRANITAASLNTLALADAKRAAALATSSKDFHRARQLLEESATACSTATSAWEKPYVICIPFLHVATIATPTSFLQAALVLGVVLRAFVQWRRIWRKSMPSAPQSLSR